MRIFLENAKLHTNRGFSVFARNLIRALEKKGHSFIHSFKDVDIQLAFVFNNNFSKDVPIVQRLDGIYFNTCVNYKTKNRGIQESYRKSKAVIIQSEFDRRVINNFFGKHQDTFIINNGTDIDVLKNIKPLEDRRFDKFENIWASSARWIRPNKRLTENVRYFLEHSSSKDCMAIDGLWGEHLIKSDRIFHLGELPWDQHIGLLKKAKYFIHLAIADHCPNSVVEARSCGCRVICSSLGGTEEIAGEDAIVIEDMEWDYKTPFNHNKPPKLDFSKTRKGKYNKSLDINDVADQYVKVFEIAKK